MRIRGLSPLAGFLLLYSLLAGCTSSTPECGLDGQPCCDVGEPCMGARECRAVVNQCFDCGGALEVCCADGPTRPDATPACNAGGCCTPGLECALGACGAP